MILIETARRWTGLAVETARWWTGPAVETARRWTGPAVSNLCIALPGQRFKIQADASGKRDFYAEKSQKSAENLPLASMLNDRAFTGFALKVGAEICRNLPA